MPDYPNAHVQVEDVDHKQQELMLLCTYLNDPNHLVVIAHYDHDRFFGFVSILDSEGNDLLDRMPASVINHLLDHCRNAFDLDRFVENYLSHTDREEGRVFRSPEPIDWDTMAKEQRMEREREDT